MKAWILVAALAATGCATPVWTAPSLLPMKAEGVMRTYSAPEDRVWAEARATLYSFGGLVDEDRAGGTLLSTTPGEAHLAAWIEPDPGGWRVTFIARAGSPVASSPSEESMHGRLAEKLAAR